MRADSEPDALYEIATREGARIAVRLEINPRARAVSVRIDATRRMAVVVSPSKRQMPRAKAFAVERAGWIAARLAALPDSIAFAPFAQAPLRGVMHELAFEQGRGAPRIEPGATPGDAPRLVVPAPDIDLFDARVRRFLKAEALADLSAAVDRHAAALGLAARKVTVKEMRSRWGSCSSDGVIAFCWRVILAPPAALDYLAAHEVAHLKEMNHSPRFWAVVAKLCPEHQAGRAWLRRHGPSLYAVGA